MGTVRLLFLLGALVVGGLLTVGLIDSRTEASAPQGPPLARPRRSPRRRGHTISAPKGWRRATSGGRAPGTRTRATMKSWSVCRGFPASPPSARTPRAWRSSTRLPAPSTSNWAGSILGAWPMSGWSTTVRAAEPARCPTPPTRRTWSEASRSMAAVAPCVRTWERRCSATSTSIRWWWPVRGQGPVARRRALRLVVALFERLYRSEPTASSPGPEPQSRAIERHATG